MESEPVTGNPPPRSAAAIARYERERAERQRLKVQALEMRRLGIPYRQIAEEQGCNVRTAISRVKKAIKQNVPQELVDATRAIELDRYDQITTMNLTLLQKAYESGDIENYCKLQDRINAIHDRRAKIVPIQQPTHLVIDQSVTTQTDQDRELTELLSRQSKEVEDKLKWMTEQERAS